MISVVEIYFQVFLFTYVLLVLYSEIQGGLGGGVTMGVGGVGRKYVCILLTVFSLSLTQTFCNILYHMLFGK